MSLAGAFVLGCSYGVSDGEVLRRASARKHRASQQKDGDTIYRCGNCSLTSNAAFDKCEQCGVADQCYWEEYLGDDELTRTTL